ncbi:alpha/beta hydrolase family protein [Cohnella massiliensis]|uniref:alpha/beta hydrolase family protein n=1 Tax=Cohnella massiliensis TaxID=1816691 RepID=UPI0009B93C5B|nr:alpha/beta hydrolase family protein [Cohnella massiliensis]
MNENEETALRQYFRRLAGELEGSGAFSPGMNWAEWRSGLLAGFRRRLGPFPSRAAELDPVLLERTPCDGYVRERVEITTFDGLRMPLYVLLPEGAGNRRGPAVLAIHGHGYGSREICGLEPDGSPRRGDPGLHKDFAVTLARQGFVVAAPELLGFGDRRFSRDAAEGPAKSSCYAMSVHLLMTGHTLAGYRVYETMRALDYLCGRSEVDGDRIGAMGISGGGLVAAFASALDERIRRTVVSGYANTFRGSILDRDHCLDNYVPGILQEAEMPELIGLIAPRALLIESGDEDRVFPAASAREAYAKLREIYEAAGAPDRLEADFFAGGHEIGGAKAFGWLGRLHNR